MSHPVGTQFTVTNAVVTSNDGAFTTTNEWYLGAALVGTGATYTTVAAGQLKCRQIVTDNGTPSLTDYRDSVAETILAAAPTLSSATIGTNGTTLTLVFNKAVVIGVGGSGGMNVDVTAGASNVSCTYASGAGTSTLVYTLGTTVLDDQVCDLDYVNPGNGLEDVTGPDVATITSAAVTNNSTQTPDVTAPTISTLSPADNASAIAIGANLVATFDENIVAGTGNVTIKNLTDASEITIAIGDGQCVISGATLTINPTADLVAGKNYAIQIAATCIDDTSGNSFAGILNDTTWNFATAGDLANIKTSMVSFYDFDADANDDHSNNHWTVTGTPTYSSGAIVLTAATNTLSMPNSAGALGYDFMPAGSPTSGTMAMWVKAQAGATNSEDVLSGKTATIKLEKLNSAPGWQGQIGSSSLEAVSNSGTPVTDQYYFVVLTYDLGTTTSAINVNDGAYTGSASNAYTTFDQGMSMAGDYTIAWLGFWNRKLTATEISALYAAGTALVYADLP